MHSSPWPETSLPGGVSSAMKTWTKVQGTVIAIMLLEHEINERNTKGAKLGKGKNGTQHTSYMRTRSKRQLCVLAKSSVRDKSVTKDHSNNEPLHSLVVMAQSKNATILAMSLA
mmetsp:Transcript_35407/g.57371  ORF Transcript_35407/g.57371 Transcript_35407/m.57371 type:complete len:114 (+) Transcript_35407:743-1084(+)